MSYHEWTEAEARREQAAEELERRHWNDPEYWEWYEEQRGRRKETRCQMTQTKPA